MTKMVLKHFLFRQPTDQNFRLCKRRQKRLTAQSCIMCHHRQVSKQRCSSITPQDGVTTAWADGYFWVRKIIGLIIQQDGGFAISLEISSQATDPVVCLFSHSRTSAAGEVCAPCEALKAVLKH